MAYKVFTNGSVLQASEVNDNLMKQAVATFSNAAARTAAITTPVEGQMTYLESTKRYETWNGSAWVSPFGLTHILSQTIGSAVSSVVVNNAFTSEFNKYRIILDSAATTVDAFRIRFNNSSGSTYQSFGFYQQWNNTNVVGEVSTGQTSGSLATQESTKFSAVFDVIDPFLSSTTQIISTSVAPRYWSPRAIHDSAVVSNTGFTVFPNSGTITGGTISVYGYKKD